MTRPQLVRLAIVAFLVAAGLLTMSRFGSLQLPTVLAYSGIVTFLCGLLSVLLPPRWLGFTRRTHSLALGVLVGAGLFAAGWFWPARTFSTPSPTSRLDAFMPEYSFHERHEILIQAPPGRVREALDRFSAMDLSSMRILGTVRNAIMGVRTPKSDPRVTAPVLELIRNARTGFFLLDDAPREFVFGLAGQPWANRGVRLKAEEFRAWAEPGKVKIAANFLIEDAGTGRSRVITETRVAASDDFARRKMAKYWALIYPGSGLLRRGMLEAIRDRAVGQAVPPAQRP
jgi:hypothetical protein